MKKLTGLGLVMLALTAPLSAQEDRSPAPDDANAYIVSPADGEVVPQTFTVVFGLSGVGVAPAGVEQDATGHHHLLVDGEQLPPMDAPLGDEVTHFGGGQTQTTLTLPPGEHTLQLILGDYLHIPHDPPIMSEPITVIVR